MLKAVTLYGAFPRLAIFTQLAGKPEERGANLIRVDANAQVYIGLDLFFKKFAFLLSIGFDRIVRRPFLRLYGYRRKRPW